MRFQVYATVLVAIVGAFVTGCGKSPFEQNGHQMAAMENNLQHTTMAGCREWVSQRDYQDAAQYANLPEDGKMFALMHRETMRMVSSTFGKGDVDPCKPGTNIWDAYSTYIKEVNQTGRAAIGGGADIVKHGLTVGGIGYAIGKISENVGDRVGGDKVESGRDSQYTVEGDNTSSGNTNSVSTTKSDQTSWDGDNTIGEVEAEEAPEEAPEEEAPVEEPAEEEPEVEEEA